MREGPDNDVPVGQDPDRSPALERLDDDEVTDVLVPHTPSGIRQRLVPQSQHDVVCAMFTYHESLRPFEDRPRTAAHPQDRYRSPVVDSLVWMFSWVDVVTPQRIEHLDDASVADALVGAQQHRGQPRLRDRAKLGLELRQRHTVSVVGEPPRPRRLAIVITPGTARDVALSTRRLRERDRERRHVSERRGQHQEDSTR